MMSSSLAFLRTVPQEQAQVFNTLIAKSVSIRRDIASTGETRLRQLQGAVQTAQAALESLRQRANEAAANVEKAATLPTVADSVSELATLKIKLALDNGKSLQELCQLFVGEQDLAGLQVLKALIPYKEDAGRVKELLGTVAVYEAQLFTPAQQGAALEKREVEACMGCVRANFDTLSNFLQQNQLPTAVSGLLVQPEKLMPWLGLPGDGQYQGPILLSDGLEPYHAHPNVPATPDIEAGSRFNPTTAPYVINR